MRPTDRKLKIFGVPWHVAHQHSLFAALKDEADFFLCANSVRKWGNRPPAPNMTFVPHYTPGTYDLAILHLDQQCVDEKMGKSRLYQELNQAVTDIPKIVIQHGTPFWPEMHTTEYLRARIRMLIGDNWMVTNSVTSAEQWGQMGKGTFPIVHGMDPSEWWDLPKEPRVVTMLSPAGLDRYYNRALLREVKDRLASRGIPHVHISVDWVSKDFDDYRTFLGKSLVYFNPTLESCMPRSRTEAMLSGCCVVTLPGQDIENYIEQGKNGFLVPNNPDACADLLAELVENQYRLAVEVGQRGKATAVERFSVARYKADWLAMLDRVLA